MSRYVINNEVTKATKKLLKQYSEKELPPYNHNVRGSFVITGFRKYSYYEEVDIEFRGDIYVIFGQLSPIEWHSSEIMKRGASKIQVNKYLREKLFNEVKDYCSYFGIKLSFRNNIKKIKWV